MFKKLTMAVGVICLMGMLTACGRTSEQKVTEIRVAFNQNENHPKHLGKNLRRKQTDVIM